MSEHVTLVLSYRLCISHARRLRQRTVSPSSAAPELRPLRASAGDLDSACRANYWLHASRAVLRLGRLVKAFLRVQLMIGPPGLASMNRLLAHPLHYVRYQTWDVAACQLDIRRLIGHYWTCLAMLSRLDETASPCRSRCLALPVTAKSSAFASPSNLPQTSSTDDQAVFGSITAIEHAIC